MIIYPSNKLIIETKYVWDTGNPFGLVSNLCRTVYGIRYDFKQATGFTFLVFNYTGQKYCRVSEAHRHRRSSNSILLFSKALTVYPSDEGKRKMRKNFRNNCYRSESPLPTRLFPSKYKPLYLRLINPEHLCRNHKLQDRLRVPAEKYSKTLCLSSCPLSTSTTRADQFILQNRFNNVQQNEQTTW